MRSILQRRCSFVSIVAFSVLLHQWVLLVLPVDGYIVALPPPVNRLATTLTTTPLIVFISQVRVQPRSRLLFAISTAEAAAAAFSSDDDDDVPTTITTTVQTSQAVKASKREMLAFAIPALGIFLTNPLMSNIDNAFVGRTVGTAGLAALSPATICTDQVLYLFSFLGRATTGIVARVYNAADGNTTEGNTQAARDAASART